MKYFNGSVCSTLWAKHGNDTTRNAPPGVIVSSRTATPGGQLTTTASGHMTLRSPPIFPESIPVCIKSKLSLRELCIILQLH